MFESISPLLAIVATIIGVLMTTSYFMQAYKIWKIKNVKEISLPFFSIILLGTAVWFLYGLSINSVPLMASNGIGIFSVGLVVILYFKYSNKVRK